MKTESPVTK